MSEWISVKERLPEKDQRVLSSDADGDVRACFYETWDFKGNKGSCFFPFSSGCGCCDTEHKNVTHWMPLPEPPHE